MNEKTVRVYDPDTNRVTAIPAAELAAGMVKIRIPNRDGEFWAEAKRLRPNTGPFRHDPFDEPTRQRLRHIRAAFADVRKLTLDEWEDGFRRDTHPHQEIASGSTWRTCTGTSRRDAARTHGGSKTSSR